MAVQSQTPCPKVQFHGTQGVLFSTQSNEIRVDIAGFSPDNLSYKWTSSIGRIVEGQGTNTLLWDPVGEESQLVSLTVQITGLPTHCPEIYSTEVQTMPFVCGLPLDEYGRVGKWEEMARLDNAYIQITRNPGFDGLLIVRLLKTDSRKYKVARLERILDLLASRRRELNLFLMMIYESDEDERTTFRLIPIGADPPDIGTAEYELIKAGELKEKLQNLFKGKK